MSPTVAVVCATAKPTAGAGASLVRTLAHVAVQGARDRGQQAALFDLRDRPLPPFDGRAPDHAADVHLRDLLMTLRGSDAVVLALPAYWGGLGGVAKNLLDWWGGSAFTGHAARTPVTAKPVGTLLVCGHPMDWEPAQAHLGEVLRRFGAHYPAAARQGVAHVADHSAVQQAIRGAYGVTRALSPAAAS